MTWFIILAVIVLVVLPGAMPKGLAMRRYAWAVLLLLIALVFMLHPTVVTQRMERGGHIMRTPGVPSVVIMETPEHPQHWEPPAPPAPPVQVAVRTPEPPAPPAKAKIANRRPRKEKPPVVDDSQEPAWYGKVESSLLPEAAAWEDVLDKARNLLTHELHLTRVPSEEFIRRNVQKNWEQEDGPGVDGTQTVRIKLELELTREAWRKLAEEERAHASQDRMETMARLTALATAILGAIAGYIRLDEWTKGYYSGRLRLAAFALVALALLAVIA